MPWLILFILLGIVLADLDTITIKGSHFFYSSNQTEVFVRGIAYLDPNNTQASSGLLADTEGCKRHVIFLRQLNINLVHVGYVEPGKDISSCMEALADADIYVLASLNRGHIWSEDTGASWNTSLMLEFTTAVDLIAPYTNTFGFVIDDITLGNSNYWPYQKAAIRDMKQYIQDKRYRDIPVGFTILAPNQLIGEEPFLSEIDFMTCNEHRADFVAIQLDLDSVNNCEIDPNKFNEQVSYGIAGKIYSRTQLPTVMTHYGCTTDRFNENLDHRNYSIVPSLYDASASEVLSGAIAHEYFQRENPDYGLVSVISPFSVTAVPGFTALSSALAHIKSNATLKDAYIPATNTPVCPTVVALDTVPTTLPPAPNREICDCMMDTLRCTTTSGFSAFVNHPQIVLGDFFVRAFQANLSTMCDNRADTLCAGVFIDFDKGTFGAFTMCDNAEIYSWAANQAWKRGGDKGCDVNGTVQLKDLPKGGNETRCKELVGQLDENGAGTIALSATSPSSTTGEALVGTATATASPNSESRPPGDGAAQAGLSVVMKVGIAVGVGVVLLFALLLLLVVLRRRRLKIDARPVDGNNRGLSLAFERKELDGMVILEVEAPNKPAELSSSDKEPVELSAANKELVELPAG
ncbi:Glucanosyltransferase-domain-containing protein [Lophiotrema nucula]|uniref:1,3-beta-glucanosyltransferase n=1 Tax=Lophiotrema nucula TaxID=690887 RepID=A0A6A5YNH8_9PLEO|nr:Glucanosyltransferase-domain-containing protein [Lophiotrema nucula]